MSSPTPPPDLLDLKMMPAWVNEPARTNDYADYEGEVDRPLFERSSRGPQRGRDARPRAPRRDQKEGGRRPDKRRPEGRGPERRDDERPPREAPPPLPQVTVRFLPHGPAFESVIAQIKSASVTYSVFALARLFLDKPERYNVQVTGGEGATLFQLGDNGPVATEQRFLDGSAFASMKDEFYSVEETQTEPLKGNFTNVARCRLSGILLGPTNRHSYQAQLRNLYEQRFSRRMSFPDYQRQIEIVSDPAVVEQWKEQARSITTYKTKGVDPELTFTSSAEAERHFKLTHLPALLRSAPEATMSGVVSRRLTDRGLGRVIENAWAAEMRSPSKMMQELAGGMRHAALNIFRHRKGMLFVSPFRLRSFGHDRSTVTASINAILEKLAETPGLSRKQLAEKMAPAESTPEGSERAKLALASDLRWLIHEGHVIEFNDGTLDLPRAKVPQPAAAPAETKAAETNPTPAAIAASQPADAGESSAEENPVPSSAGEVQAEEMADPQPEIAATEEEEDAPAEGGMSVEQTIEPITADTAEAATPEQEDAPAEEKRTD